MRRGIGAARPGGLALGVLALLVLGVVGCRPGGGSTGGGASPRGPRGGDEAGERVVALSPAVGVMMRDLGLSDLVVGKHDYDMVFGDTVPAVGHQEAIDYESLLRVAPTDVIIEWGSRPLPPRLEEMASANGWDLYPVRLLTLDDIAETVDELAIRYGVVDFETVGSGRPEGVGGPADIPALPRFRDPAEALEAELPSAALARAWTVRGGGFEGIGPVLLIGGVDPVGALGPGSFHHQILERIGGVPALRAGSPWVELDAEDVLRLDPAAIVLIAPARGGGAGSRDPAVVRERLGVLGTLDVAAVRDGRLALIDDPLALLPSTSMADFADRLAAALEAWRDAGGP
jgi:ABC-type hemin transport system substrate-binding protein